MPDRKPGVRLFARGREVRGAGDLTVGERASVPGLAAVQSWTHSSALGSWRLRSKRGTERSVQQRSRSVSPCLEGPAHPDR